MFKVQHPGRGIKLKYWLWPTHLRRLLPQHTASPPTQSKAEKEAFEQRAD